MPKNVSRKIGFGGGCHWCTEAVFQSLNGVYKVEQGWIASTKIQSTFSEAVIVHFDPENISLTQLISVHLRTHSSASNHAMRKKYRSAIYYFSIPQEKESLAAIDQIQLKIPKSIITQVLPFVQFKPSPEQFQNYFKKNPKKEFCQRYIVPKLELINELRINRIEQ